MIDSESTVCQALLESLGRLCTENKKYVIIFINLALFSCWSFKEIISPSTFHQENPPMGTFGSKETSACLKINLVCKHDSFP